MSGQAPPGVVQQPWPLAASILVIITQSRTDGGISIGLVGTYGSNSIGRLILVLNHQPLTDDSSSIGPFHFWRSSSLIEMAAEV
jgi:hypothetical protein